MIENILLALSSMSPATMSAVAGAATCRLNGEIVPCGEFGGFLSTLFLAFPILVFGLVGLMVVSSWFIYEKAHKPGWASLIPIYNIVKMLEIIGKPSWWVLLMFIPFVNIVIALVVVFGLAKAFGRGVGFGFGLLLLPFIFFPVLAFGKSQYVGVGTEGSMIPPASNSSEAVL